MLLFYYGCFNHIYCVKKFTTIFVHSFLILYTVLVEKKQRNKKKKKIEGVFSVKLFNSLPIINGNCCLRAKMWVFNLL